MDYTPENCDKLAEFIVNGMDLEDCLTILRDVISDQMQKDEYIFDKNVKDYLNPPI